MQSTTQFSSAYSDDRCDVVVGFDFGTSCSKVVLRTPYHNGGRAYAVAFGDAGHASCKYLLPSVLWLARDGRASVRPIGDGLLYRDIKYHLMRGEPVPSLNGAQGDQPLDARAATTTYLALALRSSRLWFIEQCKSLYQHLSLRWSFNLGLPSSDFDDKLLVHTYSDVARAAWTLSLRPESRISLAAASELLDSSSNASGLDDADAAEPKLIPEVAAAVAGYARSYLRDEGMHVLVDIGATTLDVCSFVLHEAGGDDSYSLLTADVSRLGASSLYRERISAVRHAVDQHVGALWDEYDPVSPMADDVGAYAPRHDSISDRIKVRDEEYASMCKKRIWKTLLDLKTKRDPHSPRWTSEVPFFLSGGGSLMPFYRTMVNHLSRDLRDFYHQCQGIRSLSLTKPDNLEAAVDDPIYHRLAVAWGLSYPETDIGAVTRPGDISDVEPREQYDWGGKTFVSKDMV